MRHRLVVLAAGLLVSTSLAWSLPVLAQGSASATPPGSTSTGLLSAADLDKLTAPVALYPDPLLSLILQASTLPLEIVQADRFLDQRKNDPKAEPPSNWDPSVLGLLNYPPVVKGMSDQLDWTQKLGNAVLNQLSDVQASVQQVRSEVRARGGLKSDDKNTVTVQNGLIEIEPVDPDKIYIPHYDYASLEAPPPPPPKVPAAKPAAPTEPTSTTVVQTAPTTSTVVVEQQSAYVYAYPPPPVVYSEPYPSYTSSAATFLGGAFVGGILGYAIGSDDDRDVNVNVNHGWYGDDHGYYGPSPARDSGNRTNISGNTVNVIGNGDRVSAASVQSQLRERSGSNEVSANRSAGNSVGPSPARRPVIAAVPGESPQPANRSTQGFGNVSSAREANATRTRTQITRTNWQGSSPGADDRGSTRGSAASGVSASDGGLFSGSSLGSRDGVAGARGAASRQGSRFGGRLRG